MTICHLRLADRRLADLRLPVRLDGHHQREGGSRSCSGAGDSHHAAVLPVRADVSPYMDDTYYAATERARGKEIVDGLVHVVQEANYPFPGDVSRQRRGRRRRTRVIQQTRRPLPKEVWDGPVPALLSAAQHDVAQRYDRRVFSNVHRRLALGLLLVRSNALGGTTAGAGDTFQPPPGQSDAGTPPRWSTPVKTSDPFAGDAL